MDLPTLQGLPNHACNTSSSPGQLIHRQLMGKHQNGRGVTWISLKLGFGAFQLSEPPHNTQILLIKVKFCSNNNTWIHHLSLSGSKRSLHSDFPISSHWQQPGEVFKDTRESGVHLYYYRGRETVSLIKQDWSSLGSVSGIHPGKVTPPIRDNSCHIPGEAKWLTTLISVLKQRDRTGKSQPSGSR